MTNTITVITPTGDRPEAFRLLEKWMERQTRQPDQWIVADDGITKIMPRLNQQVVIPKWEWKEGINTQTVNLLVALEHIKGDLVCFMEDDDWYGPRYLEAMEKSMIDRSVSGLQYSKQYNVKYRVFRPQYNLTNSPLASTMIWRDRIYELAKHLLAGEVFPDMALWHSKFAKDEGECFEFEGGHVGIKGMPGRPGIGSGHNGESMLPDYSLAYLRGLIGDDAEDYREFYLRGK